MTAKRHGLGKFNIMTAKRHGLEKFNIMTAKRHGLGKFMGYSLRTCFGGQVKVGRRADFPRIKIYLVRGIVL